jgi:hypothetical protein
MPTQKKVSARTAKAAPKTGPKKSAAPGEIDSSSKADKQGPRRPPKTSKVAKDTKLVKSAKPAKPEKPVRGVTAGRLGARTSSNLSSPPRSRDKDTDKPKSDTGAGTGAAGTGAAGTASKGRKTKRELEVSSDGDGDESGTDSDILTAYSPKLRDSSSSSSSSSSSRGGSASTDTLEARFVLTRERAVAKAKRAKTQQTVRGEGQEGGAITMITSGERGSGRSCNNGHTLHHMLWNIDAKDDKDAILARFVCKYTLPRPLYSVLPL